MLEGAVLRSPHAHARIVSIDTTKALALPGVPAIVTGADYPSRPATRPIRTCAATPWHVRRSSPGHVVAAVAATSKRIARKALDAIEVQYEVLPHVMTVDEAMAPAGAVLLHDGMITKGMDPAPTEPSNVASRVVYPRGELDKGFADADVIVERTFTTEPRCAGYIGPGKAAVADPHPTVRSTVWCSSQGHFAMRAYSAKVLGWDPSHLKVIPAEIGGGSVARPRSTSSRSPCACPRRPAARSAW